MKEMHPSNLEDHIGYWLRCLSNYVSHTFAERLENYNITVAQWVVLRTLYDYQSLTLNEAAGKIGLDKSSLSRMMERLIQKKLITRSPNEKDGRSMFLYLTAKGRELVPILANEADENDRAFFKTLSNQEKQELFDRIKRLLYINGWEKSLRGKDRME